MDPLPPLPLAYHYHRRTHRSSLLGDFCLIMVSSTCFLSLIFVIQPRLDLVNAVDRPLLFTKLSTFTKSRFTKSSLSVIFFLNYFVHFSPYPVKPSIYSEGQNPGKSSVIYRREVTSLFINFIFGELYIVS